MTRTYNAIKRVSDMLSSGMTIKQTAEAMAPSPEWVNYWRDRINELINNEVV